MEVLLALVGRIVKAMLGLMFLIFTVSLAGLFLVLAIFSWFVQRMLAIITGRPVQPSVQWIQIFQRAQAFRRGPMNSHPSDEAQDPFGTRGRSDVSDVVDVQAREVKDDSPSVSSSKDRQT